MDEKNIGFIGCGNMAKSLIGGLIDSGYSAKNIWACDHDEGCLQHAVTQWSMNIATSVPNLLACCNIIVLAVKPNHIQNVMVSMQAALAKKNEVLLISVAAGMRSDDIKRWAGKDVAVVRVMPNTPALVGAGMSVLYANALVSDAQKNQAESIMRAVGLALWVEEEHLMDAVTAVSGSGPAYYFYIMEAMEKAAKAMGIDSNIARLLVLQTAYGAAKMALENENSVADLRQRVTSPGGTTERAIQVLESEKVEAIFDKALTAARDRSRELSQNT